MSVKGPPTPRPVSIPKPVAVKKKVLEKHVERFLYKEMKKLGGECYKWSSANVRGVPDRVCVFPPNINSPTGIVALVELKRDATCTLSDNQKRFFARMNELKVNHIYVLHGKEEVSQWIKDMGY